MPNEEKLIMYRPAPNPSYRTATGKEVSDAHPKCGTCGHFREYEYLTPLGEPGVHKGMRCENWDLDPTGHGDIFDASPDHYCAFHTEVQP